MQKKTLEINFIRFSIFWFMWQSWKWHRGKLTRRSPHLLSYPHPSIQTGDGIIPSPLSAQSNRKHSWSYPSNQTEKKMMHPILEIRNGLILSHHVYKPITRLLVVSANLYWTSHLGYWLGNIIAVTYAPTYRSLSCTASTARSCGLQAL